MGSLVLVGSPETIQKRGSRRSGTHFLQADFWLASPSALGRRSILARVCQLPAEANSNAESTAALRNLILLGLSHHSAAVPGDLLFFLCRRNFNLVCSEAEKFEAVCNCGTDVVAVFSDPAGEHKKVHTAE